MTGAGVPIVSTAQASLYRAKAAPLRLPGEHLPRPHVVDLLRRATTHPLVLLQAGPGAGKTTALAEFVSVLRHPPPTYRCGGLLDTGPVACLTGICLAVAHRLPAETDYPSLLAAITLGCAQSPEQILILDDLHRVDHAWVGDLLVDIAFALPEGCSLIAAVRSRSAVADVVARAVGSDARLAVIDGAALRLRDSEVAVLSERFGKTEAEGGRWPGGYAAASPSAHTLAVQQDLISRLASEERDALGSLAVIDEAVTTATASVMLGQSLPRTMAMLRRFAADGLLVVEEGPDVFRLSPEARSLLSQLSEHEQRACRRRLALTLKGSEPVLAARYALAADDVSLAVQALDGVPPLEWMVRTPGVAVELTSQLPLEAVLQSRWPRFCRARSLIRERKINEARALLVLDEPADLAQRCELAWLRIYADLQDGHVATAAEGSRLLAAFADAAQGMPWPLAAVAFCRAGVMAVIAGDLPAARGYLENALTWLGSTTGDEDGPRVDVLLDVLLNLGATLQYLECSAEAADIFERAVQLAERRSRPDVEATCLNNLAFVLHNLGQPVKALETAARGLSAEGISTAQRALLVQTRADILCDLGAYKQAMSLYVLGIELAGGQDWSGLAHGCQLGIVRCALALGRDEDALRAQRWLAAAADDQRLYFARMAGGMLALLRDRNPALAVRYFSDACSAYTSFFGVVGQNRARLWLMLARWQAGQRDEAYEEVERLSDSAHVLGGQYELELAAPVLGYRPAGSARLTARFLQRAGSRVYGALAMPTTRSRPALVTIKLFGVPRVEVDGVDLTGTWGYRRAEELFYYATLRGDDGFTKGDAELAFAPDASHSEATHVFSSALTRLRAVLMHATGVEGRSLVERVKGGRYRMRFDLLADRVEIDALSLATLTKETRAPSREQLEIEGELLDGFLTDWADEARRYWLPRVQRGLAHAGELAIKAGEADVAERAARSLLRIDQDDELGHTLLLRACRVRQDREGARHHLAQYARDLRTRGCPALPPALSESFSRLFETRPLAGAGAR